MLDPEIQARKRQAIGLAPERPTAPRQVYVPPEQEPSTWPGWVAVGILLLLAGVTLWMALDVLGMLP